MVGIPGSGKSTAAKQVAKAYNATVICPDDIREELTGNAADQSRNKEVFDLAHSRLADALKGDGIVVFDATNVKRFARQNILDISEGSGATTALLVMDTPFDLCMERNKNRDRVVPDDAMHRMYKEFTTALNEIHDEPWVNIKIIKD
jgi:predicted kinase